MRQALIGSSLSQFLLSLPYISMAKLPTRKPEEALFLSAQNFINKIIIFNVSIDEKDRVTRKYFAVYF